MTKRVYYKAFEPRWQGVAGQPCDQGGTAWLLGELGRACQMMSPRSAPGGPEPSGWDHHLQIQLGPQALKPSQTLPKDGGTSGLKEHLQAASLCWTSRLRPPSWDSAHLWPPPPKSTSIPGDRTWVKGEGEEARDPSPSGFFGTSPSI